jgi:predicted PurR-regulated permease PerM
MATKLLVSLTGIVLVGALLVRFRAIFPPLVVAGILTYLVLPIVNWLDRRAGLSWSLSTNVLFLALILQLIAGLAAAGLVGIQQLQGLFFTMQDFLVSLPAQIADLSRQPLALGPFVVDLTALDLSPLVDQLLASVQPLLGRVASSSRSWRPGPSACWRTWCWCWQSRISSRWTTSGSERDGLAYRFRAPRKTCAACSRPWPASGIRFCVASFWSCSPRGS